jgi:hypothetical protein
VGSAPDFRFPSGPCLLSVRGARYAAGCLAKEDWARVQPGSCVLVRLRNELSPLLPAVVTSNTLTLDNSGTLGLLLRPSLACKAICHPFPAAQIRVLFLTWHRLPPLPSFLHRHPMGPVPPTL